MNSLINYKLSDDEIINGIRGLSYYELTNLYIGWNTVPVLARAPVTELPNQGYYPNSRWPGRLERWRVVTDSETADDNYCLNLLFGEKEEEEEIEEKECYVLPALFSSAQNMRLNK